MQSDDTLCILYFWKVVFIAVFLDPEGSLSATTVVLVLVVTLFRKMPKP